MEKAAKIAKSTLEGFAGLDLKRFCQVANNSICRFTTQERIVSMGTTATIVRVENEEVTFCNLRKQPNLFDSREENRTTFG